MRADSWHGRRFVACSLGNFRIGLFRSHCTLSMLIGGVEHNILCGPVECPFFHAVIVTVLPPRPLFLLMLTPIRVCFCRRELRPIVPARLRVMEYCSPILNCCFVSRRLSRCLSHECTGKVWRFLAVKLGLFALANPLRQEFVRLFYDGASAAAWEEPRRGHLTAS